MDILNRAYNIPFGDLDVMLAQKVIMDAMGFASGPWADQDNCLLPFAPSTHQGFGFTLKRTATLRFSRRMGGAAREAVMMVQADLGPEEPTPAYLHTLGESKNAHVSGGKIQECLRGRVSFQKRLRKVCLEKMKPIREHCEECLNPERPHQHLHRTTIFDTIFPERENQPRSFDPQPPEFSALADAVDLLRGPLCCSTTSSRRPTRAFNRTSWIASIKCLKRLTRAIPLVERASLQRALMLRLAQTCSVSRICENCGMLFSQLSHLDFDGAYDGWQKQVAYTGPAPRVQHMGQMTSVAVPSLRTIEIEPSFEAPDHSMVSTYSI